MYPVVRVYLLKDGIRYKLMVVEQSKRDKSLYVYQPMPDKTSLGHIKDIKFTYHPDGNGWITTFIDGKKQYMKNDKVVRPAPSDIVDVLDLKHSQMLKGVQTLNAVDYFVEEHKNLKTPVLIFDANNYEHLRIDTMIARNDIADNVALSNESKYNTYVFDTLYDNHKFVLGVRDVWTGG